MLAVLSRIDRGLQIVALAGAAAVVLSVVPLVEHGLAQGQELEIAAQDYWFEPTYQTVSLGTTVTWTNDDDESHTVTNDLGMFNQEIWPGESWSYIFTQPGVYFYFCQPHDWMIGEITVVG